MMKSGIIGTISAIFYLALFVKSGSGENSSKKKLYLAGFYTFSDRLDATGMIPAVELAVEHVNNDSEILSGYELGVIWKNSECEASEGTWRFIEHMTEEPVKLMLLGPPCSTAAEPVAEIAHRGSFVTLSYLTSSPSLSERTRFPYFFRTFWSEAFLNPAKIWLMEHFGWRRVATLSENEGLFTSSNSEFLELVTDKNYTADVTAIYDKVASDLHIENIKKNDMRIIFSDSYENAARELFCKAYHAGLYGKGYVWILPGWFSNNWYEGTTARCPNGEIETAATKSMYITMEVEKSNDNQNEKIVSGIKVSEFDGLLQEKTREIERWPNQTLNFTFSSLEGFGYDALWAAALSLDEVAKKGTDLEDFHYTDFDTRNKIYNALSTVRFSGVTGNVSFAAGDRIGRIRIQQLQGNEKKLIVTLDTMDDGSLVPTFSGNEFTWPDGFVPLDRTPAIEERVSVGAFLFMVIPAAIGLVLAVGFLIFNIVARNHRFVKLSSPRLNNLIIIGTILIFISIFIIGTEISGSEERIFSAFCMTRIWLIAVGFVLSFGGFFSKTWRVYKITSYTKVKSKKLKDRALFVQVGVILLLECIILLAWQLLDPLQYDRLDLDFGHYVVTCKCEFFSAWTGVMMTYNGLILIFGVFLAWRTKNVTIAALNDSRLIGVCIYNTTILCVVAIGVSFAVPDQPSFNYLFTSSIMNFCAIFTLITIFLPKVVFVIKFPHAGREECMRITPQVTPDTSGNNHEDAPANAEEGKTVQSRRKSIAVTLRRHWAGFVGFDKNGALQEGAGSCSSRQQLQPKI